jgi:N utilization substance protein B
MTAKALPANLARKRLARLAAVQVLYQMELSGLTIEQAQSELAAGRVPASEDGPIEGGIDQEHFALIVSGAVDQQSAIDTLISRHLAPGWRLERIDAVSRAILRAGVVELWRCLDTPLAVIANEFVEIARAFFDSAEPKFINATLDACGRTARGMTSGE